MHKIEKALELYSQYEEIEYYEPEVKEKLYWELRNIGEIVDYVDEDNGRWTNYEGVVVKFEDGNDILYLKLVKEVGKTEVQSDGDYYFYKVKPKSITTIEWNEF